jgi:hypothetical protein
MTTQDRQEEKLLEELETMYRQVAKSEKPTEDSEHPEILQSYYRLFHVSPDASLQTVKESYEQLVNFWKSGQLAEDLFLREKAERKVAEITHAYEKILAFRQMEGEVLSAESPIQGSEKVELPVPEEKTTLHLPWGKILPVGSIFAAAALAFFFWPTLYRYDTVQSGNRTYQVRTNRITGNVTHTPPLPAPASPAPSPALSAKQSISIPETKPEPAEGTKVANKKEASSKERAIPPMETKGYTIQLGAMRDLNIAREFMETQKKRGYDVFMATIEGKDRRVWYKVSLGRFADKAGAARYMEERKIKEIFPHCFIQAVP